MRRRLRRLHPLLLQSGQTRQDLNPMLHPPEILDFRGILFKESPKEKRRKMEKLLYFRKIPLRNPLLVTLGNDIR